MDIVTGANGGIGREITLGLARTGNRVVMACRNAVAAEKVRSEVVAETGNPRVEVWPLDLASFASVREFARRVVSGGEKVRVLANNAGIMCRDFTMTADGYEMMTQVNYMSPYLLTRLLKPAMEKGGMVVNTSSCTHHLGRVGDDFFQTDAGHYSLFKTYGSSKLAVLLFTAELAERWRGDGIRVNAIDPGVVNTNMITMHRWFDPLADIFFRPFIRSPRKGAETTLFLAEKPQDEMVTGGFWRTRRMLKMPPKVLDKAVRLRLWNQTASCLAEYL